MFIHFHIFIYGPPFIIGREGPLLVKSPGEWRAIVMCVLTDTLFVGCPISIRACGDPAIYIYTHIYIGGAQDPLAAQGVRARGHSALDQVRPAVGRGLGGWVPT